MKRLFRLLLGVLGITLLGASCSNNPPKIYEIWWLPVISIEPETDRVTRELILYVHVNVEEGNEDLAELRLIGDESDLLWQMDKSEWNRIEEEDELWIGSPYVTGSSDYLSEGAYTVQLEDMGGRKVDYDIYIDRWPDEGDYGAYSVEINRDMGTLEILSDRDGWFLVTDTNDFEPMACPVNETFNFEDLTGSQGEFYVFHYRNDEMWGLRYGPYSF